MTNLKGIITIGVYGFSSGGFFDTLSNAGVDLLCDIRARRGVRGAKYAFANSKRLQASLAELGIDYLHIPELAPLKSTREIQRTHDQDARISKNDRGVLCDGFIRSYCSESMNKFDFNALETSTFLTYSNPCFLCVETPAEACHRSIVATFLSKKLDVPILNLTP